MATVRQINANRANAQKSTGPKTAAGKSNASRNATKHGCTVGIYRPMRHEDPASYEEVRAGLIATWEPENTQQFLLIEEAASAYMRLRRAEAWETSLIEASMQYTLRKNNLTEGPAGKDDVGCAVALAQADLERSFDIMDRHRRTATAEFHKSLEALRRLKRDAVEAPVRRLRALKADEEYFRLTLAAPRIPAEDEAANMALVQKNEMDGKSRFPSPEPPAENTPNAAVTPATSTEMASFCEKPGPRLVPPPEQAATAPDSAVPAPGGIE